MVFSAENSQHTTDWYTFTHVTHGFVFYGILALAAPRVPVTSRFIAAVFLESAWEIAENSPIIIDRYRTATIALDYYGDSILNSVSDVFAMMLGFWMALRLTAWKSVALVLALELVLLVAIRDNLALNVLMLIYPVDAIRVWQGGL